MKFSYIITHKEGTESRKKNLLFTLGLVSSIKDEMEIILVEQDKTSKIDKRVLPLNCKHIFAYNDGLFNRGWGLNVGFKYSKGRAVALADNDIIIDPQVLMECFAFCLRDCEAIKPFNKVMDLGEQETNDILTNQKSLDSLTCDHGRERTGISFCGGLVIFRREAYEQIGGYDERFVGWGGEDDAMSRFKIPLLENVYILEDIAFHLWHERTKMDSHYQPNYLNNLKLILDYQNYSEKEIQALCKKSQLSFGQLRKNQNQQRQEKKFIIGLGTGRCGTKSLAALLSAQPNTVVAHEYHRSPLPWHFSEDAIEKRMNSLEMINGDVGFYYLNYVDFILKKKPDTRFICLKRRKEEVIASYLKKTDGRNHWVNHDNKIWSADPLWDVAYPKFDTSDKASAIGMYYDLYYQIIHTLKDKYPNNLKIFDIERLNSRKGIRSMLIFCGYTQHEMNVSIKYLNKL